MNRIAERAELVVRLETGWQVIDNVEAAGESTAALEDFWIALLRQYERTFARESSDIAQRDIRERMPA